MTHQHQHIAHQQHTHTTHNAQTHNTEHARWHRQFCVPQFAHVGLSLDPRGSPKKPLYLTRFQFEDRSRTTCSRFQQSFALLDKVVQLQFSRGPLRRESATRWFDWSLPFSSPPPSSTTTTTTATTTKTQHTTHNPTETETQPKSHDRFARQTLSMMFG